MLIHPFRALRPEPERAAQVASVPYDTVNSEEARELAGGNADSFLHVTRPEIDLPPGTDPHADAVYAMAAANFAALQARGVLVREPEPCLYVYRQQMGAHVQTGVVACCRVDDYERNLIRKHEKTRQDKEDDRTRHVMTLRANAGPIFLTYADRLPIDMLLAEIQQTNPLFDFRAPDGVAHTVWRIPGGVALSQAFEAVDVAYIADGHHRAAAAARAGRSLRAADAGSDETKAYNWFMAVLFGAGQLNILPYNRCVHDLNGRSEPDFLAAVRDRFAVTENAPPVPVHGRQVSMYLGGRWYGLGWPAPDTEDPVAALDVSVLQDRLLSPLLGIDDPRTSTRIEFVGGIRGTAELQRLVDSGRGAVAFAMYPVTVGEMMAIADADRIMPPKSTWFEPKLRSGLLVHTLD
jgi:uncharacterized protein (DUF1015 family)